MNHSRIFSGRTSKWVEDTWRKNAPQIYKECKAWSRSREAADDLFQEVALRFCRSAAALETKASLFNWFKAVIHNTRHAIYRRDWQMLPACRLDEVHKNYETLPEQSSIHYCDRYREFMAQDELQFLMEALNPAERLIVELTFLGGMSLNSVSSLLGNSKNSLCKMRSQSIVKMRAQKKAADDKLKKRDAPLVVLGDLLTRPSEIS